MSNLPETEIGSELLVFQKPTDPDHVTLLRKKADQYFDRLCKRYNDQPKYYPPEIMGLYEASDGTITTAASDYEGYGYRILGKILDSDKIIREDNLAMEFNTSQQQSFNYANFQVACNLVTQYLNNKEFLRERVGQK